MCLGVPGQVVSLNEPGDGLVMGRVSFGGVEREVCFGYAPEAKVGDYVLVHVGFAISVLDEAEAHRILEDFEALARITAEQDAELEQRDPTRETS
jgi:hydrogenase expression/formation protein HypC